MIYDREIRRYKATILQITRPQKLHKTTEDHRYMPCTTRPYKAIQDHTRQSKSNSQFHTIMCHKRRQHFCLLWNVSCSIWRTFIANIFCLIWNVFCSCFHHAKNNKNKNNNIASFRTFERCSRSKNKTIADSWTLLEVIFQTNATIVKSKSW